MNDQWGRKACPVFFTLCSKSLSSNQYTKPDASSLLSTPTKTLGLPVPRVKTFSEFCSILCLCEWQYVNETRRASIDMNFVKTWFKVRQISPYFIFAFYFPAYLQFQAKPNQNQASTSRQKYKGKIIANNLVSATGILLVFSFSFHNK